MKKTIDLQKLKKKHGSVLKFTSDDGSITTYCKQPSFETYISYQKKYDDDAYAAVLFLFKACVLTKETYEDTFMLAAGNALVAAINKAKEFSIDATPNTDEFKKSAAIIRHAFHVDPYSLAIDTFYKLLEEALWLQKHHSKRLESVYLNAFSKTLSN